MNLVFLSAPSAHQYYLINQIHAFHPIKRVFLECPVVGGDLWRARVRRLLDRRQLRMLMRGVLASLLFRRERARKHRYEQEKFFGSAEPRLDPSIPVQWVDSFNTEESVARVESEDPDLIIVFGTGILKGRILEIAKLDILNIHRSIVPKYRGTGMPDWMFYENDFDNVGTTVHRCVARIDAGDIVGQGRYQLQVDDGMHTLDYKTTALSVEVLQDVIDRYLKESVEYRKQERAKLWTIKTLTINKQIAARRNLRRHLASL